MAKRDKAREYKPRTIKTLFGLSKNECYQPNCQTKLVTDEETILAKIAHIEGASKNGPRYNPDMDDDERRSFDNLILLCDEHHLVIDNMNKAEEYPTSLLKEWKQLHEGIDKDRVFQHTLKSKYIEDFKTISFLINGTTKPIDEIYVNLAIIKDKKEESKTDGYKREALLSSYDEIHKPKEPIEIEELINTSNKSLIYGKAGVGKTTLCKYISYKWANKELYEEFDYVIYISLREWKTKGLKGAIKDNYYSQDEENITLDIKENSQKILFLFDGFDELIEDKKKELRNEINHYSLSHYIITSRPYGYQHNDFSVDEHFETIGFTDKTVSNYIDNFFKKNKEKAQTLKAYLQSNISIKHIAYIPLMLEMICSLWEEEEFTDSFTMTEIYSNVVENFLEKHSKNRDDETVYEWENREEIKELLGKIAFYGLTEQTILFDGKFIRDTIGKNNLDFFKTSIVNSGFLKSDTKDKSLLGNNFEFPHLTFQEYFSALYVAGLSKEEQSKIIRDWKFYPHMQMFFAFLGGLIENKEFLLGKVESEPKELVGFNEFNLVLVCIDGTSNLKSDRKMSLAKKIIKWLTLSIKMGLDYEKLLEKMIFISDLIDEEFVDKYIEIIISKDILSSKEFSLRYKIKLSEYITILNYKNDFFIDKLLLILESDISEKIKITLIRSFISLNRKDKKYIEMIFKILNNKKINNTVVVDLSRHLFILKEVEINYINKFFKLLENKELIKGVKLEIAKFLRDVNIYQKNKYKKELVSIIGNKNILEEIRKILKSSFLLWEYKNNQKTLVDLINSLLFDSYMIDKNLLVNGIKKDIENFEVYINIVKNKQIDWMTRNLILHTLVSLKKDNKIFISMLTDKTFDEKIRGVLLKSLVVFKKNDFNFSKNLISMISYNLNNKFAKSLGKALYKSSHDYQEKNLVELIKILKDTKHHYYIRLALAKVLFLEKEKSNQIIDIFLSIIKNDTNKELKIELTKLLINIGKNENKIMDYIINIIQSKEYDLSNRTIIVTNFLLFSSDEYKDLIIMKYFSIIKDEKRSKDIRQLFISPLIDIEDKFNEITNEFLEILNNENILFNIRHYILNSLAFSKEKQLYYFKKLLKYENIFFQYMTLVNLYQLYDEKYDVIEYIIDYILNNNLNIYIKNNKLYTIENGKEISTQREVDEETLNEIKMLLKRNDLDD